MSLLLSRSVSLAHSDRRENDKSLEDKSWKDIKLWENLDEMFILIHDKKHE